VPAGEQGAVASFLAVKPTYTCHVVSFQSGNRVSNSEAVSESSVRMNGGYVVLRPEIFDYMWPGDELVEQPFRRLIAAEPNTLLKYVEHYRARIKDQVVAHQSK